jgi:hypothetical protein
MIGISFAQTKVNPITTTQLKDGTVKVRVALNYVDTNQKIQRIRGVDGIHTIEFPLPGSWEILDAKGYIDYDSSILMMKDHSAGLVLFNNVLLTQFKLFNYMNTGVKFKIAPELFTSHNSLNLEMIQHYTHECEDGSSSELWSDINLEKSYLEFHVRLKPIPQEIRSIVTYMLDEKQYEVDPINYVMSRNPSDEELRHYMLFTGAAANQLKYRIAPISASYTIKNSAHNVIIASKSRAKEILKDLDSTLDYSKAVSHDINIIRNPFEPDKAIVLITPADSSKIDETIYALYKKDLSLYRRQGLDIEKVEIPEPAPAYSAKNYIPVDKKVFFKELGYKTKILKGWYPPKIELDFKVYPDHYFNKKDRIKTHIRYVFPTTVHYDSVANIYLNDMFAKQIDIMKVSQESTVTLKVGALFDWTDEDGLPAYLVGKGYNKLKFDFSLVPDKKGHCEIYNTENLLAMVMDDSYFILPESKRWIEMPYLQLISTSTYPYSIYPDLQDTQFVLSNNRLDTIAATMNFTFFLTQEMQSFPSYLGISQSLNPEAKDKHLIFFGSIHDNLMQEQSADAPVSFAGVKMNRAYPFVKHFIEHESILNEDRTLKYRFIKNMHETNQLDSTMLMQIYRSPYNSQKTVLMLSAENGSNLNAGIKSILKYENRHLIQGDTILYDPIDEEGISFDIKQKYIISSMNWLDKISLIVSANPVKYVLIAILILLFATWLIRRLLIEFKGRKHKNVK